MEDPIPTTTRRVRRKQSRPWWRPSVAHVALLAVLVAVLVLGFDLVSSVGRIHRGVEVGGIAVGRMTRAEARAALETGLPAIAAKPVTFAAGDVRRPVTADEIGLWFDYSALVEAAYAHGRTGGLAADVWDQLSGWVVTTEFEVTPLADQKKLRAVISDVAKVVEVKPRDATVVIEGVEPRLSPAQAGVRVAREKAAAAVLRAFVSDKRTVVASLLAEKPAITDDGATAALADAWTMMSEPVTMAFDAKTWEFAPSAIAAWISFRARGAENSATVSSTADSSATAQGATGTTLEAFIDPKKAAVPVIARLGAVGRPAKDASFQVSNGRVSIVPSQDGVGPDIEALAIELTQVLRDPERLRSVDLRTRRVPAAITTAKARTMGIKERISRYTTTYAASNKPRVGNIHLLSDALNGTLLAPGATFSFNDTIGPRTAAKGYQEAPAIVNGKLVPQLGGGICQVGTTIFNTVFESGLPVVRRQNHSFYISHYPKGRDATVSWGGPDFRFKNDTENWVLIVVAYTNSSLTIALYGTDPGYEVRSETGAWENEKPFSVEEIKDPTLLVGARVVEDGGVTGRSITVKRYVTKDGQEVRTDTFRSVYKPKTEVTRVGTKPVAPSTGATQTVKPEG